MREIQTNKSGMTALAFVAMAGVAYQVALVRLLSVVLWYHFAFLVVSLAVLGIGLSGVMLVLRPTLASADGFSSRAASVALGLAGSVLGGYLTLSLVPFDPFRIGTEPIQLLWGGLYVIAMMAPFFLNGLFVGMVLIHGAERAGTLYAADLIGAGVAAIGTLAAFSFLGGEGALLIAGAFAAVAALALRKTPANGAAVVVTLVALVALPALLPMRISEDKQIAGAPIVDVLNSDKRLDTKWNALSRVDVVQLDPYVREILIDAGVAVTRLPRVSKPIDTYQPIKDFTCLGFALVEKPSVLVLGSGGGWEVACALTHGSPSVTGVELNPAINDFVTGSQAEWTGHVMADPRVHLKTAEARAYLSRTDERWDVIVSAHTISNSASASGAMNLAESYTLTVEAFGLYLSRLTPGGILYVTRPEGQLPRLIANISEALRRQGMTPEDRVVAIRLRSGVPAGKEFTAGVLVALDPSKLRGLRPTIMSYGAVPIWGDDAVERTDIAQGFVKGALPLATDDRPFFQFRGTWLDLTASDFDRVFSAGTQGRRALENAPVGEVSLLVLLLFVVIFSAGATAIPLWLKRDSWKDDRPGLARTATYFAALGFGYMFAELALVHRLGVFLGSPTITFGVVVAGLLVCSGIGAAISQRFDITQTPKAVAAAALVLAALGLASHKIVPFALTLGAAGAVFAALVFVVPVGIILGMPFPLGMRMVNQHRGHMLPVAWGFNGFAGVLASALSILIATEFGFAALLVAAAATYGFAALVARNG
ncbi:MAG: class I SAM-dependent methyltransferase [bacterium]